MAPNGAPNELPGDPTGRKKQMQSSQAERADADRLPASNFERLVIDPEVLRTMNYMGKQESGAVVSFSRKGLKIIDFGDHFRSKAYLKRSERTPNGAICIQNVQKRSKNFEAQTKKMKFKYIITLSFTPPQKRTAPPQKMRPAPAKNTLKGAAGDPLVA